MNKRRDVPALPEGMLWALARRYENWRVPAEDLMQEGRIAAWQAEADYDASRGASLRTIAWKAAKCAMLNYLVSPPSNRQERAPLSYHVHDASRWKEKNPDEEDCTWLATRDFAPFLIEMMSPEPELIISDTLTPQELKCLRLMCTGIMAIEAAQQIGVTRRTVEFHLNNVYRKWGVVTLLQAFIEAMRRGLIAPPARREEE